MLDRMKINYLVRALWTEFSKGKYSDYTDTDLNLWTQCTVHNAIQDKLTGPESGDVKKDSCNKE